eukprot:5879668-Pyramimonas_sp.AAC.1
MSGGSERGRRALAIELGRCGLVHLVDDPNEGADGGRARSRLAPLRLPPALVGRGPRPSLGL